MWGWGCGAVDWQDSSSCASSTQARKHRKHTHNHTHNQHTTDSNHSCPLCEYRIGEDKRLSGFFPKEGEGWLDNKGAFFPVYLAGFWTIQARAGHTLSITALRYMEV